MTPKIIYSTLRSKFYIEISAPKSFRPKSQETTEMKEESSRQASSLRVAYQRESDIPKVPYDNNNFSYADSVIIPSQKITQPKIDIPSQPPLMMPIPTMQGLMPSNMMDPSYINMMMGQQTMPLYFPKMLLNNNNTKPINYRTEACKNFHSAAGCTHGDACHFIHDFTYEGRPIPNMAEWRRNNNVRMKNIEAMKNMQMGIPTYYPPPSEPHLR